MPEYTAWEWKKRWVEARTRGAPCGIGQSCCRNAVVVDDKFICTEHDAADKSIPEREQIRLLLRAHGIEKVIDEDLFIVGTPQVG